MLQKVAHLLDLKYEEVLGFQAVKLRNNVEIIFLESVEEFVSAINIIIIKDKRRWNLILTYE